MWEYDDVCPCDVALFATAPFSSRFAADFSPIRSCSSPGRTINFHLAGTSIKEREVTLTGRHLVVGFQSGIGTHAGVGNAAPLQFHRDARAQMLVDEVCRTLLSETSALPGEALLIDGLLTALQGLILSAAAPSRLAAKRACLSDAEAALVADHIEASLDDGHSLASLATLVGREPISFTRAFLDRFRQTPHQYLIDRRIQRARELLEGSSQTIADIAYGVGFSSQAHLTSTFTKRLGVSPARYRRECKL